MPIHIVCISAVAYAAANQHPLHIQCNLPKHKQSSIKLVHLYPNQTLFANISEQKLLSQAHYSHAAEFCIRFKLGCRTFASINKIHPED